MRREYNAFEVVFKLVSKNSYDSEDREIEKLEVLNLSDNETHKKLLREYGADEGHDAVFWLECDEIMDKTIKDLDYTIPAAKKWSLRKMNFDNTFGYGSHNTIDFGKLSGVVGLFGPNRCGKSSIPGTLMYSLYNSNDRGLTSNAHVVNYRKKEAIQTSHFLLIQNYIDWKGSLFAIHPEEKELTVHKPILIYSRLTKKDVSCEIFPESKEERQRKS